MSAQEKPCPGCGCIGICTCMPTAKEAELHAEIAAQRARLDEVAEIIESMRGQCDCEPEHVCGWPRIERWLATVKHRLPKGGE